MTLLVISLCLPVAFICGFALGVWGHVVAERIEGKAKARRTMELLYAKQEQMRLKQERVRQIKESDLPLSASEEKRRQEEYAPELRKILGMDDLPRSQVAGNHTVDDKDG